MRPTGGISLVFHQQYISWCKLRFACGGQTPVTHLLATRVWYLARLSSGCWLINRSQLWTWWDTISVNCFIWQISCAISCQIPYRIHVSLPCRPPTRTAAQRREVTNDISSSSSAAATGYKPSRLIPSSGGTGFDICSLIDLRFFWRLGYIHTLTSAFLGKASPLFI